MGILKLFNLPSAKQTIILLAEEDVIMKACEVIASQEFKEQKENQKAHNNRCPKCRADQDKIVDKISSVEGKELVSGRLYLGFGKINSSIELETKSVNYCRTCGHEWLKYKIKYISKTDIIRVALKYLGDKIQDPETQKRFSWKTEAIQVFDDCHAETIKMLIKEHMRYLNSARKSNLQISNLRKYYPSIFDDEIKE